MFKPPEEGFDSSKENLSEDKETEIDENFAKEVKNTEQISDKGIMGSFYQIYHKRGDNKDVMKKTLDLIEEYRPEIAKIIKERWEK